MDSLWLGLNTIFLIVDVKMIIKKSDTAGSKHLLEIEHTSSPIDFQDVGNQMKVLQEMGSQNANR